MPILIFKLMVVWMLDLEEFLMLRDLFNKELSISEIARRTGHSREMVRRYLVLKFRLHPRRDQRAEQAGWLSRIHHYEAQAIPLFSIAIKPHDIIIRILPRLNLRMLRAGFYSASSSSMLAKKRKNNI